MKARIAAGGLLMLAGVGFGQDADPFADVDPFAPVAPAGPPEMVRVQVEFVEVAHADYTKLMAEPRESADATALRVKLAEMVEEDRAEVVETMMVVAGSGDRATSESVREFIYPTEYCPPGFEPPPTHPSDVHADALRIPGTPTAFETRNLGSTFEIAPILGTDGKTIDLRFAPGMVVPAGYAVHQEFTAIGGLPHQERHPIFVTGRLNTAITCRDGQYVLVTVLTPSDDEGQLDPGRKMLVLVKCDVLLVK